jgi:hypothetical protein
MKPVSKGTLSPKKDGLSVLVENLLRLIVDGYNISKELSSLVKR